MVTLTLPLTIILTLTLTLTLSLTLTLTLTLTLALTLTLTLTLTLSLTREHGAHSVTMLQRSAGLVVSEESVLSHGLGSLYSEAAQPGPEPQP